jgi:hypothetical protein
MIVHQVGFGFCTVHGHAASFTSLTIIRLAASRTAGDAGEIENPGLLHQFPEGPSRN